MFLLTASAFLVAGCALAPKNFSDVSVGQWESRALVKDKKSNRSFIVYMNFIAEKDGRLRMDVTSSVGSQISSMVVEKNQVTLLLLRDKKFFRGSPTSPKLINALNLPIDPRIFSSIVFDLPVEQKGWSCTRDEKNLVSGCKNLENNVSYTVSDRSGEQRAVMITHPRGTAQVNFTKFNEGPSELEKVFTLPTPSSFTSI